jgi:DNA-binding MarR family transcriptional regulator
MMRNVTLNINDNSTESEAGSAEAAGSSSGRESLIGEILVELSALRATEQRGHFGAWARKAGSMAHLHVLAVLEAEGARSVGRIAQELDVSLASATGIVGRMEERGLIRRGRDPKDRRVVLVELTDAGRTVRAEIEQRGLAHLHELLGTLSAEELRHFLLGVRALRAARARLADRPPADRTEEPA